MRIRELHLMNFGKFTDTHIYFPGQLHVIFGENEYGKSTIYAFIKPCCSDWREGKDELQRMIHFHVMSLGRIRIIMRG